VKEAHLQIYQQTELAHYFITEFAHSSKKSLSLKELRKVLNKYGGPSIRCNRKASVGGTILIECCRARYVRERVILSCARELIEKRGALPDISSEEKTKKLKKYHENNICENPRVGGLTPLCIAAARGMPLLVRYLLKKGASTNLKGTGSFRLFSNPNKSITGSFTPLEFATTMRNAEINCGVNMEDLVSLETCIKMLSKTDSTKDRNK